MNTPELLLIPLILGLVQVAKQAGLPKNLAPLFSVSLGFLLGELMGLGWLIGVVAGLSAMGLYSGSKASVNK